MSDLINNLGLDPLLLIAQIVNFLLLLLILWKFAYKPIVKMLDDRSARIKKSMDDAKRIEEETAGFDELKNKKLQKVHIEADKITETAKAHAEKIRREIVDKANAEADEIIAKSKAEMKREKQEILKEVKDETARLATLATERMLSKHITEDMQHKLVDEAISEIDKLYQK